MKTITVKGTGKVSVKPDLIVVSMRLETAGKEYEKTTEDAARKIELINNSLKDAGFEKDAVKTTSFNVRADYENVRDENGRYVNVFKGYVCNHGLKIQFDFDTKRLAKVLSAVSSCVAKPEFSVSFTVKDPSAISKDLLNDAAKNAKEKAEILCAASGVRLGELTNIDYNFGHINAYSDTSYEIGSRCMAKAACLSNIDVTPDDIDVSDSATFVWEIL